MNTPWGHAQSVGTIADGITQVDTASHGGIKLSPERNALVHEAWRAVNGWYEEDCEAYIPAVTFPDEFAAAYPNWTATQDHEAVMAWFPDQYEQVYGVTVTAEQSIIVRDREFHTASGRTTKAA